MHPAKFPNEYQAGIHGTGSPASGQVGSKLAYTVSKDLFGTDERTVKNFSRGGELLGSFATAAVAYNVSGSLVNKSVQPKTVKTVSSYANAKIGTIADASEADLTLRQRAVGSTGENNLTEVISETKPSVNTKVGTVKANEPNKVVEGS